MKKSRFTQSQIVQILKEGEARAAVADPAAVTLRALTDARWRGGLRCPTPAKGQR